MTRQDEDMLANLRNALAKPFADPVLVQGRAIPRSDARTMERLLLRVRVLERNSRAILSPFLGPVRGKEVVSTPSETASTTVSDLTPFHEVQHG